MSFDISKLVLMLIQANLNHLIDFKLDETTMRTITIRHSSESVKR